jgi:hypothetical protein
VAHCHRSRFETLFPRPKHAWPVLITFRSDLARQGYVTPKNCINPRTLRSMIAIPTIIIKGWSGTDRVM